MMSRLVEGSTHGLADVEVFLHTLETLDTHPVAAARGVFVPVASDGVKRDVFVARAPGRLDVMGGIADYSGSLVLQLPTREATFAAIQRQAERTLRIVTLNAEAGREPLFEMSLDAFEPAGRPVTYEAVREIFRHDSTRHWASYAAGAFVVLMRERGVRFDEGAQLLVASDVPEGKGVSSSAALEVAVMQAVAATYGIGLQPRELAVLCQKVENLVAGAPCGVMDQMTAACGQAGRLLALLCQPAELQEPVEIPDQIEFWGLDSGVRHSVAGADYGSVRVGAFMGYRIVADVAGLCVPPGSRAGPVEIDDPHWHGYLANIEPPEFESRFAACLPERIRGGEFLERYFGTTDPTTRIDPAREYAVRTPAAHPVHEHFRVRRFRELLCGRPDERQLEMLGELMYASHAGYSACGLGCQATDRLVSIARELGPARGLYGAKITGGGSGGTVAVLARRSCREAVHEVADRYEKERGHRPYVFSGSSMGAGTFGHLVLRG